SEQPEFAHFGRNFAIEPLLPVGSENAGKQLLLRVGAGGIAHHPLVLGKLVLEEKRILPIEACLGRGSLALLGFDPFDLRRHSQVSSWAVARLPSALRFAS